jgi:hypothetical protein
MLSGLRGLAAIGGLDLKEKVVLAKSDLTPSSLNSRNGKERTGNHRRQAIQSYISYTPLEALVCLVHVELELSLVLCA